MFSPADGRLPQVRTCLPHHTGGYPGTSVSLTYSESPPSTCAPHSPHRRGGGGRWKTAPPSASCLTLGWGPASPCHDPQTRKVCLLFFPGKASLPWPSPAATIQPQQKTRPSDQQRLSCSDWLRDQPRRGAQAWGRDPCHFPGQAGLQARLPGAGVGTCPRKPPGRGLTAGQAAGLLPGHLEPDPVCACVCVGVSVRLPGHVGGWELRGCDPALLASLWLPCGQFYF